MKLILLKQVKENTWLLDWVVHAQTRRGRREHLSGAGAGLLEPLGGWKLEGI